MNDQKIIDQTTLDMSKCPETVNIQSKTGFELIAELLIDARRQMTIYKNFVTADRDIALALDEVALLQPSTDSTYFECVGNLVIGKNDEVYVK